MRLTVESQREPFSVSALRMVGMDYADTPGSAVYSVLVSPAPPCTHLGDAAKQNCDDSTEPRSLRARFRIKLVNWQKAGHVPGCRKRHAL